MRGKVADIHSNLTIDLLREIYNYDPITGKLTRRINRGTRAAKYYGKFARVG